MEKIIKDNCILCNKIFNWHEIVSWKLPENIWFCQNCFTKFEDKNTYTDKECWFVVEFEKWIEFEYIEQ